ncbi:MAG: DNA repair protein RecO [Deltaproteobacteria bacterium]
MANSGRHHGPRSYRSARAFLVRSVDTGETDRRISFFTESDGLVSTVAKAARRSRKRFGGNLQKYFLLDVSWTEAPGRIPVLESVSLLESFWEIVTDWEKVRHADYLLELASAVFPQPGPKPKAFGVLLSGMRSLAHGDPPPALARKSEAAFLAFGGWGPNFSACRRCGQALGALPAKIHARSVRFVLSEGGILCGNCPGGGTHISLGAVKTWKALQASSPEVLARVRITESIYEELQFVIPRYLEYCLGKPLRSLGRPPSPGTT